MGKALHPRTGNVLTYFESTSTTAEKSYFNTFEEQITFLGVVSVSSTLLARLLKVACEDQDPGQDYSKRNLGEREEIT